MSKDVLGLISLIKTPQFKVKSRGEVRTAPDLVDKLLDNLPKRIWRKGGVFLDPCCGRGTFLIKVAERLSKYHSTKAVANMIHGIDIDPWCVYTTTKALQQALDTDEQFTNIIQSDFITWDSDMKFDVIVGNPPFQEVSDGGRKDQASNLWSKFWSKSLEITKDTGTTALITPTSWLSPSADLKGEYKVDGKSRLWEVFDSYSSYANVIDVSTHFQGVGSTFGYVIVNKSSQGGLKFSDQADTSLGFLPKSGADIVSKELSLTNNLGNKFTIDQDNKSKLRVSIPLSRVLNADSIEILNSTDQPTKGSPKSGLYLYVYVDDLPTAKHVKSRIETCLDILNTHCRYSGFMNIKILKMVRW